MKRRGQTISEFAIVAGILVAICVAVLFLFGDNIKEVFNNSRTVAMFDSSSSRTSFEQDSSSSSDITLTIGGLNVDTALVSKFASKGADGVVQTSGSSGNISETMQVMLATANNLIEVLKNFGGSMDPATKALIQQSLAEYLSKPISVMLADGMKASDSATGLLQKVLSNAETTFGADSSFMKSIEASLGTDVFSDVKKLVNDKVDMAADTTAGKLTKQLELSIDVNKANGGEASRDLEKAVNGALDQINDAKGKALLEQFTKDLVALGSSIEVKIDSRVLVDFQADLTAQKTAVEANNTALFADIDKIVNTLKSQYPASELAIFDSYKAALKDNDLVLAAKLYAEISSKFQSKKNTSIPVISNYNPTELATGKTNLTLSDGSTIKIDLTAGRDLSNSVVISNPDGTASSGNTLIDSWGGNDYRKYNKTYYKFLYNEFKNTSSDYFCNSNTSIFNFGCWGFQKKITVWPMKPPTGSEFNLQFMVMADKSAWYNNWSTDTVPLWIYNASSSCVGKATCDKYIKTLYEFDLATSASAAPTKTVSFGSGVTVANLATGSDKLAAISPDKYQYFSLEKALTNLIPSLSDDALDKIQVYREGNFDEIMANSFNNTQLCKTLGGTPVSDKCEF